MTGFHRAFDEALSRGLQGEPPDESWIVPLLTASDEEAPELFSAADRVRAEHVGNDVHLRALVEFSNWCRRNCNYCGLRRGNRGVSRYRFTPEEVVTVARDAEGLGFRTIVLQSGEDPWFSRERMAGILRSIRQDTDLAITLSVGERDFETYREWKEAGADRCLVRIETTDPELFRALHPDDDLRERMQCIEWLRDLGYQVGSGVMVGLPGQTPQMLARDVVWLHEIGAEMIGVGPFIAHPATPLAQAKNGTVDATLRLVAVLRLVMPWAHIPATTAMGTLEPRGRERALQAGANVMMPNMTPAQYRARYEIYPDKICLTDDGRTCAACTAGRIRSLGRTIATDRGDAIRGSQRRAMKANEQLEPGPPKPKDRRRLVVLN